MRANISSLRILAIHPTSRGFGFVVLEGPTSAIDWAVKATRAEKAPRTLTKVRELLKHYRPELLVVEDGRRSRHCRRILCLVDRICSVAKKGGVRTRRLSSRHVRKVFRTFGAHTKYQIAHTIAQQLPELAPWLPRFRKPWMSEDYHMPVFEAAALALTHFYSCPLYRRSSKKHLAQ